MSKMSASERAQLERWVAKWREAGPALDRQTRHELERLDTPTALAQLADAFAFALARSQASDTSGLVQQQVLFQRLAR